MGLALSKTLYQNNTTLWFRGELGAGKTTFIKGLGVGLGLGEIITSPTYALENRYDEKFLHIDLYRLDPKEALRIIEESEEFPGLRAVEWSERLEEERNEKRRRGEEQKQYSSHPFHPLLFSSSPITINISELSENKRSIEITFADIAFPDRSQIESWREEVKLPKHIRIHCDAVAKMARKLGCSLMQRGIPLRLEALTKAAELHDLLRFIDFRPEVQKKIPHAVEGDEETKKLWKELSRKYPGSHEEACAHFVRDHGYPEIATIVRPHGLSSITDEPETIHTIEQKLLFYADKRVKFDEEVSLDERFDEFMERYGNGIETSWAKEGRRRTKELEKELFGENIP